MILTISRAECFSPNSVDKDAAILECVSKKLIHEGYDVVNVSETALKSDVAASAYISMARSPEALAILREKEREGALVVNGTEGVALCCNRRRLTSKMRMAGIPIPADKGADGYWLKRGDGVTESCNDVQFAANDEELEAVTERMKQHGINDIMVSAHVKGDLIKFYGVRGSRFFRAYYPGDDGQWKFFDELRNGCPNHYLFSIAALHDVAERTAMLADVDVYGGDCIICSDGSISIIDFNDWPSFSRCREEAAVAITRRVIEDMVCNHKEMKKK